MSGARPTISVIIPAYNYAATLPRAVASVCRQLGGGDELIVVDDGSTDDTPDQIRHLAEIYPLRTRFIRKENGGPASARNRGIEESVGDYLLFLDADDELLPDALSIIAAHLAQHPDSRFIIGGHVAQTPDGRQRQHLPPQLPGAPLARVRGYLLDKTVAISNGACLMHRSVFERANYPEKLRNSEDIPVFCQALANFACTVIQEPLAIIYKHDDSLRHQVVLAKAASLSLADEVFRSERLGESFQPLKPEFELQRYLSLFRTAYLNKDTEGAKEYFRKALQRDWRIVFRLSYSRKALRLWLLSGSSDPNKPA